MIPQVLHPTMEHRLISTPHSIILAERFLFQPGKKVDSRAEVLATTPCSISLSSHLPRRVNAVGRLDERK
jgi:hypothetical protein